MESTVKEIASKFCIKDNFIKAEPFGSGHINDTYKVVYSVDGKNVKYIFQKINTKVFRKPENLMENVSRVLDHSAKKLGSLPDSERRCIHLVPTVDGKMYYIDGDECWRSYKFIDNACTYNTLETEEQAYQAAKAFGNFQMLLADLPGERLHETIPNFHNTPSRLFDFDEAVRKDVCGRAETAKNEIRFVQEHRWMAPVLIDLMKKGEIPERITHNDTKLNNVLLDDTTGEGICVLDLDTVMPGLSLYDFGDLVRTSVSPADEDETDLSKVCVRMDIFRALVRGFLDGAQGCLTKKELELLPFSGELITFEIGLRFLTDYLNGDNYFKISRDNHNLDRCRTQFMLVKRLIEQEKKLKKIVKEFMK